MSLVGSQALAVTPQYKTYFPEIWILSTAESRATPQIGQEDGNGHDTNSSGQDEPPTRVRESLPPVALLLNQTGLATPNTPTSTASNTTHKRRKVTDDDISRQETTSDALTSTALDDASAPRPDAKRRGIRAALKKLLPKFNSEKSQPKEEKPASPRIQQDVPIPPPLISNRQTTTPSTSQRAPFQWPNSPPIFQQPASQLYSVPEGSPTRLTADSLGMTVRQSNSTTANYQTNSSSAIYSPAEPMTATTGISSRSSNYADVPSRLPRFRLGTRL